VGIEIPVTRLVGKWKVSQNRTTPDRAGIAAGLATSNPGMAAAVQASGK
jgi:transcriptional regulator